MGVTSSRIEEDKALILCRRRKHFVKEALEGRCALAAAHVSYIMSLQKIGTVLAKFVEPEVTIESSLCTSTSATPEPLALTDKSTSQFSSSSPSLSQNAERAESLSPLPSPFSGGTQLHYTKSKGSLSETVEEKLPFSVTATIHISSVASPKLASRSAENTTFEDAASISKWDYFNDHPINDQFSFHDSQSWNHGFDSGHDFRQFREEGGFPELEEEEEMASDHVRSKCSDSEDDFDQSSSEPLVRIFKNRNQTIEHHSTNGTSVPFEGNVALKAVWENDGRHTPRDTHESVGDPDSAAGEAAATTSMPFINERKYAEKERGFENRVATKDLLSSVKEIESLFVKASESGEEVPRMLEADRESFRLPFTKKKALKAKGTMFFSACFVCCKEEIHVSQEPATNNIKYLTWHRSVSSRSSSSRNPIGTSLKDDIGDSSSSLFSNICMNSGSHASTLDRLYAWERKLYDEVKACGIIHRKYDTMCRQLRDQESKEGNTYQVDKLRMIIKDLHSSIRVALHRIYSISKRTEELRDKELLPQLEELIGGLLRMWEKMHAYHKLQYDIISAAFVEVNSKLSMQSEYHHQVALALENELNGLSSSFSIWIKAHRSYLQAINGWLLESFEPVKDNRKVRREQELWGNLAPPPIYVTCKCWLRELDKLSTKEMATTIKKLAMEATRSLPNEDSKKGNSNQSFSIPKAIKSKERLEYAKRDEDPLDWSLCLESFQGCLKSFLEQLQTFAEKSAEMYRTLEKMTEGAKNKYQNLQMRA